jgi:DNA-directed RNA polymerase omega subunit
MPEQSLLSQALDRVKNRFLLTNVLAKRIMQLRKGSVPLVETDEKDYESIALQEIVQGKLEWEVSEISAITTDDQAPLEEGEDG